MKLKNHQALAKRIRITKTGKALKRHGGQDHFNSRDSGKVTRNKRRDQCVSSAHAVAIKTLIPYR
jgi:ribosomal protein L35